jgi:hypothetical protein
LPPQVHAFGNIGLTSPLYTYLTVPCVALFGLSETTTRLPALIINVLLILIVYRLVLRFFDNPLLALLAGRAVPKYYDLSAHKLLHPPQAAEGLMGDLGGGGKFAGLVGLLRGDVAEGAEIIAV